MYEAKKECISLHGTSAATVKPITLIFHFYLVPITARETP